MIPTPPPGFTGTRGSVLGAVTDGTHHLTITEYTFPDGTAAPYVELHETHDGARPGRVVDLSTLVHLAQNVGEDEIWQIGNR